MVIVSRHGAQLAFVGIFCGFARARLERNQDLRNQHTPLPYEVRKGNDTTS